MNELLVIFNCHSNCRKAVLPKQIYLDVHQFFHYSYTSNLWQQHRFIFILPLKNQVLKSFFTSSLGGGEFKPSASLFPELQKMLWVSFLQMCNWGFSHYLSWQNPSSFHRSPLWILTTLRKEPLSFLYILSSQWAVKLTILNYYIYHHLCALSTNRCGKFLSQGTYNQNAHFPPILQTCHSLQ